MDLQELFNALTGLGMIDIDSYEEFTKIMLNAIDRTTLVGDIFSTNGDNTIERFVNLIFTLLAEKMK